MRKTQILINKLIYLVLSILDLSEALLFMSKQIIFTNILQKMLKQDLTLQILN